MELKDFKRFYSALGKKYSLPSFERLNQDFDIEKIERESDNLLKNIRKVMMEKIINSLTFLEMLVNPVNAPRMYLSYIRSMTLDDKKLVEELYYFLAGISVESLDLEIDSSEKSEAAMIKRIYDIWQVQKPKFRKILSNIKKPSLTTLKREKSYFG